MIFPTYCDIWENLILKKVELLLIPEIHGFIQAYPLLLLLLLLFLEFY